MNRYIEIISIAQFDIRVAHSICNPCFIVREGQFSVSKIMHKFES